MVGFGVSVRLDPVVFGWVRYGELMSGVAARSCRVRFIFVR